MEMLLLNGLRLGDKIKGERKMYKVGDIFTVDNEYSQRAQFCNENNLMIVEIEKSADGKRQFQIQEVPAPTKEEILNIIRSTRESECFPIINRGSLWYDKLTDEQKQELSEWYENWLNTPQIYQSSDNVDYKTILPEKPQWLI